MLTAERVRMWEEDEVTKDVFREIAEKSGFAYDEIKAQVRGGCIAEAAYWSGWEDALEQVLTIPNAFKEKLREEQGVKDES